MTATSSPSQRTVLVTGAGLLALWASSFALSYAPLGAFALPVALGIAALKAALVLVVFMELRRESLSIQATLLVAVGLFVLLAGGMMADLLTRDATDPPVQRLPPAGTAGSR